jgi:putative restriction endonuclease
MLSDYLKSFENLRTDVNRHRWSPITKNRAPYKPLLILTVLDLIAQGEIKNNLIALTPEFCETFILYWSRVMPPERKSNIAMPFFYLTSDGFWHLVPYPGKENELQTVLNGNIQLTTVNQIKSAALGAKLDDELFELVKIKESRDKLRSILIKRYFAPEAERALLEQSRINDEAHRYSLELLKENHDIKIFTEVLRPTARSQGFRFAIVKTYEHRCTTCGIKILTADGHTIVEAAHIIPFSISKNDDPKNGLCLCRSCHWSFDEGLISISEKYQVLTSPQLNSDSNLPSYVVTLTGRGIIHPAEEKFLPDLNNLAWHRKEIFRIR